MAMCQSLRFTFLILFATFNFAAAVIDKSVLNSIDDNDLKTTDVLIHFAGANTQVIKHIQSKSYKDRPSKVKALVTALKTHSEKMHAPVEDYLESNNLSCAKYWASNQMITENITLEHLQKLASFPQVARIQELPVVRLAAILTGVRKPFSLTARGSKKPQWGVKTIQADQVWRDFSTTGGNVTVANIDTGVRGTHEALRHNFREDHGWFDPYTRSPSPDDFNGHGTHTMGIMAGSKGIGVAPGAQWMACRGCSSSECATAKLITCGEWMMAPTNPDGTEADPELAPDIVSNSWGTTGDDTFFNPIVEAWYAAGILSVFSIGNDGPECGTGGSPGMQRNVFSVGSTDKKEKVSSFSSKGPAGDLVKPDVAAPGEQITSSWPTDDSAYNTISGTSMATPHVGGIMALALSTHRTLVGDNTAKLEQRDMTRTIRSTTDVKGLGLSNKRCYGGGILSSLLSTHGTYPNNELGTGRVNAWKSVVATLANDY